MRKYQGLTLASALLCTLFAASPSHAQTFKPQQFVFNGAPAFSTADLTTTTGLTPGQVLTPADIDQAAQHLSDTGLFADVRFNVNNRALTFTLVPQDASLTLPAVFSNFVVLDPQQLPQLIHARVPLFIGIIPNHGNLNQAVQDALTAILLDKGITATVDSISASNTVSGGPIDAMVYSLSDPAVRIHQLRVDGVSAVAQNKVDIVRQAYIGTDFDRLSGIAIQRRLQDAYRDLGFLDITIDTAAHSAPTIEPKQIFVDVSTAAHEGSQYHIVRIDYPASTIVSPATFENGAALKPGDPAAQYLIGQITQRIDHEFHRRGYLDEETQLAEKKDTTAHTVAYSYTVEPGDLYHFKGITLPGATEEQQKAFDRAWALKPGAPLDRDYVMLFFQKIGDLATFHGYTAKPAFAPNRNDHTVQITAPVLKADSSGH